MTLPDPLQLLHLAALPCSLWLGTTPAARNSFLSSSLLPEQLCIVKCQEGRHGCWAVRSVVNLASSPETASRRGLWKQQPLKTAPGENCQARGAAWICTPPGWVKSDKFMKLQEESEAREAWHSADPRLQVHKSGSNLSGVHKIEKLVLMSVNTHQCEFCHQCSI